MLSEKFQKKVYDAYRFKTGETTVKHGKYEYSIAYNDCCTIHTWIIRRKGNDLWHWLQPLDKDIY